MLIFDLGLSVSILIGAILCGIFEKKLCLNPIIKRDANREPTPSLRIQVEMHKLAEV